jgi:hypothetical protein
MVIIADMLVRSTGRRQDRVIASKLKVLKFCAKGYINDFRVAADGKPATRDRPAYMNGRPVIESPEARQPFGLRQYRGKTRSAEGPGWPGRRCHQHLEGHHDRRQGTRRRRGWRSPLHRA